MPLNEIPTSFPPEIRSLIDSALEQAWLELRKDNPIEELNCRFGGDRRYRSSQAQTLCAKRRQSSCTRYEAGRSENRRNECAGPLDLTAWRVRQPTICLGKSRPVWGAILAPGYTSLATR